MSFNASDHTSSNKSYAVTGKPELARMYYLDKVSGRYRPYVSTAEVIAELDTTAKRQGHPFMVVNTGGTLADGIITGGTNDIWYFKDSTANGGLVRLINIDGISNEVLQSLLSEIEPILNSKADLGDDGFVDEDQLKPKFFANLSGSGESDDDPYIFEGGGSGGAGLGEPADVTGFDIEKSQVLYQIEGEWQLGDVPSGIADPLPTPELVLGSPSVNAVPSSWEPVLDALQYELRRGTTNNAATATIVYNGTGLSFVDSGLVANTQYYWFLRAKAAGRVSSAFDSATATTPATGDITPPAPTSLIVNDGAKTFTFTNAAGFATTAHEYRIKQGGVWGAWADVITKPISVGNLYIPVGDLEVRVKASTGIAAGPTVSNTSAFIMIPAAPTNFVTNDEDDEAGFTPSVGFVATDHEYQINNGTITTVVSNPIPSGDITIGQGQFKIRVKAGVGRTVSDWLVNTVPFTGSNGLIPVTEWVYVEDFVHSGNNLTGAQLGGAVTRARSAAYIPAGQVGSVQARGYARIALDEGPTVDSYAVQFDFAVFINTGNMRFAPSVGNTSINGGDITVPQGVVPVIRIRVDATTVHFAYSLDLGATWNENPTNSRPRTGGDLYIKADQGFEKLQDLLNILATGVLINNSL